MVKITTCIFLYFAKNFHAPFLPIRSRRSKTDFVQRHRESGLAPAPNRFRSVRTDDRRKNLSQPEASRRDLRSRRRHARRPRHDEHPFGRPRREFLRAGGAHIIAVARDIVGDLPERIRSEINKLSLTPPPITLSLTAEAVAAVPRDEVAAGRSRQRLRRRCAGHQARRAGADGSLSGRRSAIAAVAKLARARRQDAIEAAMAPSASLARRSRRRRCRARCLSRACCGRGRQFRSAGLARPAARCKRVTPRPRSSRRRRPLRPRRCSLPPFSRTPSRTTTSSPRRCRCRWRA